MFGNFSWVTWWEIRRATSGDDGFRGTQGQPSISDLGIKIFTWQIELSLSACE